MPNLLTEDATILCPHEGIVTFIPTRLSNLAGGAPVLVVTDVAMVEGCTNEVDGVPIPCLLVEWTMPAAMVTAAGAPVLTKDSVGLCISVLGIPAGEASIEVAQPAVSGE